MGRAIPPAYQPLDGNRATVSIPEGKDAATVIKVSGKNRLYLVEFQEEPKQQKLLATSAKSAAANKIWLQMVVNGKTTMLQTPPVQLLQPPEVY